MKNITNGDFYCFACVYFLFLVCILCTGWFRKKADVSFLFTRQNGKGCELCNIYEETLVSRGRKNVDEIR